jgi:ubiquinone/menaquinone biosynthesis C-methylase UbiE
MLDRVRYLARHIGLTAVLSPVVRSWHFVLTPRHPGPPKELLDTFYRRHRALLEDDLGNVRAGYYPKELLFDFPIKRYAKLLPYGVVEFPSIYRRRAKKRHDQLPPIENRDFYPDYYLRTFHWQSDGWLSDRSARLYDASVEVLFLGTAGIMRRMAIPPLVDALRSHDQPRILDVACGTGRFLGQVHRAMPRARLAGIDLSPYYLRSAHDALNGVPGVALVADNAEAMPFEDGSFDAVTSVFLFHELPKDARRNVYREMFRVVRPGGVAVVVDSAQRIESPELDYFFDIFPRLYHEPYFKGYVEDPIEHGLEAAGFTVRTARPNFLSKLVVVEKR